MIKLLHFATIYLRPPQMRLILPCIHACIAPNALRKQRIASPLWYFPAWAKHKLLSLHIQTLLNPLLSMPNKSSEQEALHSKRLKGQVRAVSPSNRKAAPNTTCLCVTCFLGLQMPSQCLWPLVWGLFLPIRPQK